MFFAQQRDIQKVFPLNANNMNNMAIGDRMHLHPHPQKKLWMDAGRFVNMDTATSGFALRDLFPTHRTP